MDADEGAVVGGTKTKFRGKGGGDRTGGRGMDADDGGGGGGEGEHHGSSTSYRRRSSNTDTNKLVEPGAPWRGSGSDGAVPPRPPEQQRHRWRWWYGRRRVVGEGAVVEGQGDGDCGEGSGHKRLAQRYSSRPPTRRSATGKEEVGTVNRTVYSHGDVSAFCVANGDMAGAERALGPATRRVRAMAVNTGGRTVFVWVAMELRRMKTRI